jgi:hypothetical protein
MPLPSPRVNEDLNDFIGRCVIDPNVVNDFATSDQRLAVCNSLYSQEKEIKAAKENYTAKFSEQLTKAERSSVKDFYKFYNDQYDQASAMFIRQGALSATDVSVFFKENDLINMYTEMYSKIGLHFALWYYKNVDKLLNKASDLDNLMSIWSKSFAFVGQQVGAQRVTLVSGTAKNTLIAVTQKLMSDPAFMNQGEKVKAKMLKTQFNRYSTYQAKRLVRTEATNAANYATIVSAQSVFDGRDLMKTWHTSLDGRERASHGAANGQTVPNAGKFSVQGQFLKWAGDPAGSASNVINCRCGVSVFPKPNAQTTGENITDIGFGVAQAQVQSAITEALITPEVATTIAVEAQQVNLQSQKELMRPDNWDEFAPKSVYLNDDYLSLLTKKPTLTNSTASEANIFTAEIYIKKSRFTDKSIGRVLAHEVGHVIHYQQKWVTYTEINPLITSLMDKQAKRFGMSLRGADRRQLLYETNKKINSSYTFRNKFPDLNDDEFNSLIGGMADYFGALTKNSIGFGHQDKYYKGIYGKNFQAFEIMAHAFENKYFTNPLFELMFPVEYKESIQLLDELILNIK